MVLPPEFTSLYRVFLRATSTSVLHNGPATRSLRRLYRPTFEAAACAIHNLESSQNNGNITELQRTKHWLETFDKRINNTLSFLLTSSLSRGLTHRVTSHISLLMRSNHAWNIASRNQNQQRIWNPHLPPDSPEYSLQPPSSFSPNVLKRAKKQEKIMELDNKIWGALGEVINMAEGKDELVMGKVTFNSQSRSLNKKKKGWDY